MVAGRDAHGTAAAVLERRKDEILAAYEAALRSTESSLLREERNSQRYVDEARQILGSCDR
ncbi:hypothetical protein RB201_09625 [Streptomyces sp. S1A(2023)]